MPIGSDFAVAAGGAITHVSGSTNYTVLAFHRWLNDLADDAQSSSDDFLDITKSTPSERSTDNIITLNSPYFIDDTVAQFLYDGSITQLGGDTIYAGLVVVGAVESGTQLQVWQEEVVLTSFWSTGINSDATANILSRMLIKTRENGSNIDGQKIIVWARELSDTYAEFSVTMALGNNVAAIFTSNDLNNQTTAGTISGWSSIVNTPEGYQLLDIAGDGSADEPYYSKWDYGTQSEAEVYERTKWLQRRGTAQTLYGMNGDLFRGITSEFAYINGATPVQNEVIAWGTSFAYTGGTGTAPAVGQYWSNSTVGGVGKVVWVSAGAGATGTVVIQRESPGATTWASTNVFALLGGTGAITASTVTGNTNTGGSGVVLAFSGTTAGTIWMQIISGAAPASGYLFFPRGTGSVKRGDVSSAVTARTIKPEFIGTYTGSSLIGAFGIGIDPADGVAADLFTTLTGGSVNPPNNQQFTVFGLISGDRVLVANNSSGAPDFAQLTLATDLVGATETAVVVTGAIPADTPTSGKIRIQLDTGIYREQAYTSWATSTFTIASASYTGANNASQPRNVFIGYLDLATATTQEAVTMKYTAPRTMFVRVRNGGGSPIKTFETTAAFGSGGGSATAIRTSDA